MTKHSLALLTVVGLAACSDRPSREKFPGGQGRTTDTQQAEMSRAMLGGFDPLNNPISGKTPVEGRTEARAQPGAPGAAEAGGGAETKVAASGPTITGTLSIGKGLKAPAGALLYIAARRKGQPGPPLAVIRTRDYKFPFQFEMSSANAMMQGTAFEGNVEITARLDQDGDPLSRTPGDIFGVRDAKVGDKGLKISLDQAIK